MTADVNWEHILLYAMIRSFLREYAPGRYTPEMSDEEVEEVMGVIVREVTKVTSRIVSWLDVHHPGWNEYVE
ncbi:hypothetical protein LCGC14_2222660 [marine sediment metagenome]|uniref:Uncharacterized protein n=1 Tax=marine sediment metagenome TaxID=412755 RepID=A0A0F9FN32_9ZZZZ